VKTRGRRGRYCVVHPSHEAAGVCRVCGKNLCERCLITCRWGIYCSTACRARLEARHFLETATGLFLTPVSSLLSFAIAVACSLLLLSGILRLHGEYMEVVCGFPGHTTQIGDYSLSPLESGFEFQIHGPPGKRLLLTISPGRPRILRFDRDGKARTILSTESGEKIHINAMVIGEDWELSIDIPGRETQKTAKPEHRPPSVLRTPVFKAVMGPVETPPPLIPRDMIPPLPTPFFSKAQTPTQTPSSRRSPATRKPPRRPRPKNAPPILHIVTDGGRRIALTFDGGASANRTSELLDLLQELNIRATLFLTGEFIEKQPVLVRRAVLAGHEIGNHTYSHPHLTSYATNHRQELLPEITREYLADQLHRTESLFERVTGHEMAPLWRAPFGEENAILRAWALEEGYLHVRWSYLKGKSLDTLDWVDDEHSPLYRNSREIVDRLLRFPHLEGGIILMHLATDRKEPPWEHLPEFVRALRKRNLQIVRISQLLEASPTWKKWLHRAEKRHRQLKTSSP